MLVNLKNAAFAFAFISTFYDTPLDLATGSLLQEVTSCHFGWVVLCVYYALYVYIDVLHIDGFVNNKRVGV